MGKAWRTRLESSDRVWQSIAFLAVGAGDEAAEAGEFR